RRDALGVAVDRGQELLRGLDVDAAGEQGLGVARDRGDRRAQLVRGVGQKLAAHRLERAQPRDALDAQDPAQIPTPPLPAAPPRRRPPRAGATARARARPARPPGAGSPPAGARASARVPSAPSRSGSSLPPPISGRAASLTSAMRRSLATTTTPSTRPPNT